MVVPGVLVLALGFTITEPRLPRHLWRSGQVPLYTLLIYCHLWDRQGILFSFWKCFTVDAEPALPFMTVCGGNNIQVGKEMKQACATMWATLGMSRVWQPTTYMYLSWALSPDIGEGKFYWFNDVDVGPGFSKVL